MLSFSTSLPILLPFLYLQSSTVSSAPTNPPSYSPSTSTTTTTTSNPFTIRSCSTFPAYDNLHLASYHTGAGLAYAVLDPKASAARTWALNGTTSEYQYQITELITVDNKNAWEGLVVRTGSTEGGVVEINAGEGSQGTYTTGGTKAVKSGEEVKVNDPQSGGWYACKKDLVYGPAIQLFWKSKQLQSLPRGCADVVLKTKVKK